VIIPVYRVLSYAAIPFISWFLQRRKSKKKEHPGRLKERFGYPSKIRPKGNIVWLHAASVGEAISALSLIKEIKKFYSSTQILITTGTVTSERIMAERLPSDVIHQFIPIDQPIWIKRFLSYWDPCLILWMESEFWPNFLTDIKKRKIPLILINARISQNSYKIWKRFPKTISRLMNCFILCMAQSERDANKLIKLGAKAVEVPGNLKYAAESLPADDSELTALWNAIGKRPIWIAASTHQGEEAIVADAHRFLSSSYPNLLTIIIPRHPIRGNEIASSLSNQGFMTQLREERHSIEAKTEIYIANTIGELGLFYRLSPIAFVGGTLIPHGGQNLLEAAKLDCAIIHGPSTDNFTTITKEMSKVDGSILVHNKIELAEAVSTLMSDETRRQAQIIAASNIAKDKISILGKVMNHLSPFLTPDKVPPNIQNRS
tara:strand:- start:316 stop:1611 length:1296 start_codon:yes stop_codon:yes gene_type:complete